MSFSVGVGDDANKQLLEGVIAVQNALKASKVSPDGATSSALITLGLLYMKQGGVHRSLAKKVINASIDSILPEADA